MRFWQQWTFLRTGSAKNQAWEFCVSGIRVLRYHSLFLVSVMLLIPAAEVQSNERSSIEIIKNLKGDNPQLQKLRREIALNLKSVARGGNLAIPLRLVRYRVAKNENFYTIMARVSQNADTLSSLNQLSNPNALLPGQIILIPNARGVFRNAAKQEVTAHAGTQQIVFKYGRDRFRFHPGQKYQPEEMRYFRGDGFMLPLQKSSLRVSSRFGIRRDPFHRKRTFHGGIDLAAKHGTPVMASRSGKVVRAQKGVRGYGQLVVIKHKYGYATYYGHLSSIIVRRGQTVRAGQIIGRVGATGRATGPHLHFEVRKNGQRHNPARIHGLTVLR